MIRNLDPAKVAKLHKVEDLLEENYGKRGTPTREAMHARACKWYFSILLKDRRMKRGLTQKQLAEMLGKERSYVSSVEQGKPDVPFSAFFDIANALDYDLNACTTENIEQLIITTS